MFPYFADLANSSVPRYTSYPTAAEFRDGVTPEIHGAALDAIAPGTPVSLYLHVPFCRQICWYCACNTSAIGSEQRLHAYVDALLSEIATVGARMRGSVSSIHFGGGSPNALSVADLGRLLEQAHKCFRWEDKADVAMELDPRLLTEDVIDGLLSLGLTRASLGVQTFAPHVQSRINRVQSFGSVAESVERLRGGVDGINFDLLYGLPAQTEADVAATIERTLELAPSRIAVFGYAHVPHMMPRQQMIATSELPGSVERFRQSVVAHEHLTAGGYAAIGFDHFAAPTDSLARAAARSMVKRNFQGFTDDPAGIVVGMGSSAISMFPGLLAQNEKRGGFYRRSTKQGALATARGVARTAEDRFRGAIIEQLLCQSRCDVAAIAEEHAQDPASVIPAFDRLAFFAERGLVTLDGWRVALSVAARPYARSIASAFDAYRNPAARFSKAV
ncbi:MAG: oxygen-independent coproporphyrinogen III oxidase [Alphaproteobacteria bacterium]|nr:oxygen-independent coproporphyrinogen III oxidase [Alphaproteobacteria bacterium]